VKLFHRLDGAENGPLLVLSNSLGTTTRLWEPQLDAFTAGFRVLRHDHPGHGDSPLPDAPFSVEEIAYAVLHLVDELGAETFSFCGLSLGGMVGMCLAAGSPERVETLTLCCTGAKLGTTEDWLDRAATVRDEGTGVLVNRLRERWFTPAFRESSTARNYLDDVLTIDPQGYARCCEAIAAFDFRDRLGRIDAPTLMIVGAEDPVTPPDVVDALSEGISNVETVLVPNAAHLANVEQPEAVAAAVLRHAQNRAAA
jgi:3-oxoadipate enol-lactonase